METVKNIIKRIFEVKSRVITLTVIAVFCIATIVAAAANANTILVDVDGEVIPFITLRTDAYEILDQLGIEIGENDIVDLSDYVSGSDSTITVHKAYKVKVYDGDNEVRQIVGHGTVGETLKNNGITVNDGDVLSSAVDEKVYEDMEIVIVRAFQIIINADGELYKINIAGGTVSDALNKAVLTLGADDIISKPLDTPLEKGMAIKITRVSYVERTEKAEIPFKTTTKNNASMSVGQSKIEVKGVKGEKTVTYKDKYVDGKLKESTAINEAVNKKPVNEVKIVGTKKAASNSAGAVLANGIKTISRLTPPASLKLNGTVPTSYKKKIVGTASAYSGGGVTATGRTVMDGYIAVNPRQIPYHTKMWIVSNDGRYVYGYASAEDTGGFINWTGSRSTLCDLYFSSSSQASQFGRRSVTIYVL